MSNRTLEVLDTVLKALEPGTWESRNLSASYLRSYISQEIRVLKITKEEVEEVRHISKLQESAEELPYAVRNLNLPDLEDEEPIPPTFSITRGIGGFITGMEILTVDGKPVSKEDHLEEKRHLIELNEHKNFAREDLEDDPEDADYLASKQDAEEEDAWEAKRELAREDREDEEIDRLAREEVESSLYEDGIIEDPDCDGGLNG